MKNARIKSMCVSKQNEWNQNTCLVVQWFSPRAICLFFWWPPHWSLGLCDTKASRWAL